MSTTTTTAAGQTSRPFNSNLILLLVVSFLSFFFAEQILTGWLPLGDRLNLSRRDFNAVEIAAAIGAIGWGLITLRVAWGFFRHEQMPTIRSYFMESAAMPSGILLTVIYLGLVGLVSLVIAEQVFAGWLPLGERVNISRRDINLFEWLAIIFAFIWGALNLLTLLAFLQRDRRAWTWGQWLLLLNAVIAVVLFLSGIFEIRFIVPTGGTFFQNLPGVMELLAPVLVAGLSALVAYRYLTAEIQLVTSKEISGTVAERALSRDTSTAVVPADQSIRNTLARFPGAGAVVGFLAIFVLFLGCHRFISRTAFSGKLVIEQYHQWHRGDWHDPAHYLRRN